MPMNQPVRLAQPFASRTRARDLLNVDQQAPSPPPISALDYLGVAFGLLLSMAVSYLLGRGRIFWEDEMLGWMLVTDPSWHHMVQAWKLGADGGGFTFYATCRVWLDVFGRSEVAYRMYSAVCFGLAFALNWATARRFYGRWVTAFALFNTYFCSRSIVLHLAEGRFYGLLMLGVACMVWLAIRVQEFPGRLPARYALLVFAAHALTVTTHLLGIVYSAALLAAMVLLDRLAGRWRPWLYGSAVCGWLLLIPERTAILASAAVGKPWFWTTQPPLGRFLGAFSAFGVEIALVLALLTALVGLSLWRRRSTWQSVVEAAFQRRKPIWVATLALLLVPFAILIEGWVGTPLYIDRYLLPVAMATAFLTAELLTLVDWDRFVPTVFARPGIGRTSLLCAVGFLPAAVLFVELRHPSGSMMAQPDYTSQLSAILPHDVPVLLEDAWTFTEVIGRQHDSGVEYLYPLDWKQSTSSFAPRLEVTQYNLMNNWRKAGYFPGSVIDLAAFLRKTATFLVVDDSYVSPPPGVPLLGDPLVARFRQTPGYHVTRYAALSRGGIILTAWQVTHQPEKTGLPLGQSPRYARADR
jgi:hypothetical protein